MASISSAGKFDSVDLDAKVNAVSALARPINEGKLSSTASNANVDAQISSIARIQNFAAAVNDAGSVLMQPATWHATHASSSDEATVSAQSDSSANREEHIVVVDSVAMAQMISSALFSSIASVIGIGTMNIEMGSWNTSQTTFTTNPNWPKASVVFGPRDNSLDRIRDKINAAGIGVIAAVMSDATGSRLVLRATSSGATNGFKVSTVPAPGESNSDAPADPPLSVLQFDPSSPAASGGMTLIQPAQNAKLTIDGQLIESDSNTIHGAVKGLTLTLHEPTNEEPVTVRVDHDTGKILRAVTDFAHAYNGLRHQLDLSASDQEGAAKTLAATMRGTIDILPPQTSDGDTRLTASLADVGLRLTQSGRLDVDESRLAAALTQRPEAVRARLTETQTSAPDGVLRPLLQQLSASLSSPPQRPEAIPQGLWPRDDDSPETASMQRRQKLLEQYQPNAIHAQPNLPRSPA